MLAQRSESGGIAESAVAVGYCGDSDPRCKPLDGTWERLDDSRRGDIHPGGRESQRPEGHCRGEDRDGQCENQQKAFHLRLL